MNIKFSQQVKAFLQEWAFTLFEKHYFSFYENADEYVTDIIESIYENIPHKFLWKTPLQDYFKLIYGKNVTYIKYKVSNSKTVWYILFEYSETENAVLIHHITNGQKDAHRIN
ncbi:MAG: hypothetical protein LBU91_01980 [Bacteroidales bacterium]|jgi:hypothetical protein|nr:hypothetical protein [Bacteroidales bacterium]